MDFSLETLTATINEIPHVPTQLGDSGLFTYQGIATLTVDIESDGYTVNVVPTGPRGAPGTEMGRKNRKVRTLKVAHIPMSDAVLADEVQGVRAFGTTDQPEPAQNRLNEVLALGRMKMDYTLEYHRVGALKGIVLDADGSTEILNLYTEFGVAQNTFDFDLDTATTDVRTKCDEVLELIQDELGGVMMTGAIAWCGKDFFRKLIGHKSVKETYLNQAQAAELRGAIPQSIEIGGITFRRYRGMVNGQHLIGVNDCYLVPTGVPNLLIGRFAPAPYIETVNTLGLPMYAKGIERRNNTGWDLEMNSSPFHASTRPRAIVRGFTG